MTRAEFARVVRSVRIPEPYTPATLAMLEKYLDWSRSAHIDAGEYVTDLKMELVRAYACVEICLRLEAEDRHKQAIKIAWSGPVGATRH